MVGCMVKSNASNAAAGERRQLSVSVARLGERTRMPRITDHHQFIALKRGFHRRKLHQDPSAAFVSQSIKARSRLSFMHGHALRQTAPRRGFPSRTDTITHRNTLQ